MAIGAASAAAVVGAGAWIAVTGLAEPHEVCERRAAAEFEQLETLAAPLADKQVGENSRDLECWGKEPRASLAVRLPKAVTPDDAMNLLGTDWQVSEGEGEATTVDGV